MSFSPEIVRNRNEIDKGTIIKTLEGVVDKAHSQDPHALGLILFGSRSRERERPGSDVDIIPIIDSNDSSHQEETVKNLLAITKEEVGKLGLAVDPLTITGKVEVIPLGRLTSALSNPQEKVKIQERFGACIDRHSYFITSSPGLTEILEEVFEREGKEAPPVQAKIRGYGTLRFLPT